MWNTAQNAGFPYITKRFMMVGMNGLTNLKIKYGEQV